MGGCRIPQARELSRRGDLQEIFFHNSQLGTGMLMGCLGAAGFEVSAPCLSSKGQVGTFVTSALKPTWMLS